MRVMTALLFTAGVALPSTAIADDTGAIGYQLETAIASTYVARGVPQYATRSTPSSQTTSAVRIDDLGGGSLTVSLWTAVALDEYGAQPGTALEFDPAISYAHAFAHGTVAGGYTGVLYPEHLAGTPVDGVHELFVTTQINTPIVSPIASANVELVRQQGAYVVVGAVRDLHVDRLTVSPVATFGLAAYQKYQGADVVAAPHANDVTVAVGARYDLPDHFYVSGRISYSARLTPSELAPDMTGWDFDGRSSLYGAIAVGTSR